MLANRVTQLERTIGKEQQNSVQREFQSMNLEVKTDIPHPDFSKTDNKPRIQESELHAPDKDTNGSKLKTCDDRILTLERTVGMEIEEADASLPNESEISKIRRTKEKNSPSKVNINKKRLLSPVTTPYPSNTIQTIAFYAYMSKHTPTITIQYPLTFDVVKTNFGNGYHSTTGVFMVPESGVYVFTWTIRIGSNNYHATQLMVNTDELGIIYSYVGSGPDLGGTGIVVAHVDKGDDVYVRTHALWNSGVIYSDASGRSSFAGWRLF
ncbi:caprin-2-like [Saccostrea cucullata]|uniref:caprin-2-like n=1 Tax=Saccostrea cuccullata TaxID=36930 RepID=UPI002ED4BBF4